MKPILILILAVITISCISCLRVAKTSQENIDLVIRPVLTDTLLNTIKVLDSRKGKYLADGAGKTLYTFSKDESDVSNCYNSCAYVWRAFTPLDGKIPEFGEGVNKDLLGVIKRKDNTFQATYNHKPLYYFVDDKYPKDKKGLGLLQHGGNWNIIRPDGTITNYTSNVESEIGNEVVAPGVTRSSINAES